MPTEKLKQVALLITQAAQQADTLPKDGFQVTDIFVFFPQLAQIGGLIKEKDEIVAEFKSLTDAEIKEMVQFVADQLTLTNKRVEAIIERGFAALGSIYSFIEAVRMPSETPPTV